MATKKTTKKPAAKKVAPSKVTKKSPKKKAYQKKMKSFKMSRETMPFMTFRVTDQTIYWTVLLLLIVVLFVWVLRIQIDIATLLINVQ